MKTQKNTQSSIMDTAQRFIQQKGFNAFSYADVAKELDIKTASIHYYFPSKTDLGVELMKRYRHSIGEVLDQLDQSSLDTQQKLEEYVKAYQAIFTDDGRICLGVMLSSDIVTLHESIQQEVKLFLNLNHHWLAKTMRKGVEQHVFTNITSEEIEADTFLSTLIGSMLIARANQKPFQFYQIGESLLTKYKG
jgi:TetR/AcrR family transcriptional repressor of nem operon